MSKLSQHSSSACSEEQAVLSAWTFTSAMCYIHFTSSPRQPAGRALSAAFHSMYDKLSTGLARILDLIQCIPTGCLDLSVPKIQQQMSTMPKGSGLNTIIAVDLLSEHAQLLAMSCFTSTPEAASRNRTVNTVPFHAPCMSMGVARFLDLT